MRVFERGLLIACWFGVVIRPSYATSDPLDCRSITSARIGDGVRYESHVANDDYGISLDLPEGLSGWGAVETAPFHGFTVFLPTGRGPKSCLVFEVNRRVGDDGQPADPSSSGGAYRSVRVGRLKCRLYERSGIVDGISTINRLLEFTWRDRGHTFQGEVWLVSNAADLPDADRVWRQFVDSLRLR